MGFAIAVIVGFTALIYAVGGIRALAGEAVPGWNLVRS